MPTYGYECKSCGYTFDAFQSMSDEPLQKCPKCGKRIRRLVSGGSGIIFKGSGFYVTDKGKKASEGGDSAKTAPDKSGGTGASPCACCGMSETQACPKAANS